uniref:Uncharacterized protein n=1 Tax=Setaria italica TaxID=4555 RepID=K3ZBB1_SETIT
MDGHQWRLEIASPISRQALGFVRSSWLRRGRPLDVIVVLSRRRSILIDARLLGWMIFSRFQSHSRTRFIYIQVWTERNPVII